MIPRDVVKKTVLFENPDRLALHLPKKFGNDFTGLDMAPNPDKRASTGTDEWGCIWENIGLCTLGEVKEYPIKTWDDFGKITIPDIKRADRWTKVEAFDKTNTDKFVMSSGISLYERSHFLRGLENIWVDIYEHPEQLGGLLDVLAEMNIYAIEKYAEAGADGFMLYDDWGLQNALMISPGKWREIWKPRYAKVYEKAHSKGMLTFLHSCGYITEIMDDLIEAGLDVIQMDQQMNMGLERLGKEYKGRITFWCPVDIQSVMPKASEIEIRRYVRKMINTLGRIPYGGFIAKWYPSPEAVGHREEAVNIMCDEFLKASRDIFGK